MMTTILRFSRIALWSVLAWGSSAAAESRTIVVSDVSTRAFVAFSPDGTLLANSNDDQVQLRDAATGQLRKTLEANGEWVQEVVFSPDGRTLAGGGDRIRLWDVATGELKAVLEGWAPWVAFSPDGGTVASCGDRTGTVRLWDAGTGDSLAVLEGNSGDCSSVAFSPDGGTVVSGNYDGTVRLWDVETGQPRAVLEGHRDEVTSVAFSPDGEAVVSGSYDSTVRLWDAGTGTVKAVLRVVLRWRHGAVAGVAYAPDGVRVASGGRDGLILLWDLSTGRPLFVGEHGGGLHSLAYSPDGTTLASSGRGRIALRSTDFETGDRKTIIEEKFPVHSVVFSRMAQPWLLGVTPPAYGERTTAPLLTFSGRIALPSAGRWCSLRTGGPWPPGALRPAATSGTRTLQQFT